MKRRDFLKTAGTVVAGTTLLPKPTFSQDPTGRVLILGAGIAGLAAAYLLKRHGVSTTLIEARNRPGGRIFTHSIGDSGLTCELGAEWVGASHTRLIDLCREFSLALQDHRFETSLILNSNFRKPGQWGFTADWARKYEELLERFNQMSEEDKKPLDKLDWWRYLVANGISEIDLELRELLDSTDFGETIRQVSAYAGISEYAESSPKNEMDFHIQGGNSHLVQKMVEAVGSGNVILGSRARKVEQGHGKVRVYTERGERLEGDFAICTVPTWSLMKMEWEPALSRDYREALEELQYSRIIKTSVLFSRRFWKEESFDMLTDTLPHYFFHSTKNQNGRKGILTSYATGDKAHVLSKMNERRKIREICDTLKIAFGNVEKYAERAASYYWGSDHYTQGAYAVYNKNQWLSVRAALARPEGRIHFAGEHLADWQGFMEGAINSGEDAARRILEG